MILSYCMINIISEFLDDISVMNLMCVTDYVIKYYTRKKLGSMKLYYNIVKRLYNYKELFQIILELYPLSRYYYLFVNKDNNVILNQIIDYHISQRRKLMSNRNNIPLLIIFKYIVNSGDIYYFKYFLKKHKHDLKSSTKFKDTTYKVLHLLISYITGTHCYIKTRCKMVELYVSSAKKKDFFVKHDLLTIIHMLSNSSRLHKILHKFLAILRKNKIKFPKEEGRLCYLDNLLNHIRNYNLLDY